MHLEDLMKEINDGNFDDIINASVQKRDENLGVVSSPTYLDWLYDEINTNGSVNDDINNNDTTNKEFASLLSYLKMYLQDYCEIKSHTKSDSYGFSVETLYFGYKKKYFKVCTTINDVTIVDVSLVEKKPKNCINIDD